MDDTALAKGARSARARRGIVSVFIRAERRKRDCGVVSTCKLLVCEYCCCCDVNVTDSERKGRRERGRDGTERSVYIV